jgi:MFS family permease
MEWASSQKNNANKNSNIPSSEYHQQRPSPSVKIPASAWKTLAILSCVATMVMYAETMLIPAIPDLIKYFDVSYSMSSWILTAYLISGAVMTPIAGKLSDHYGKKKILLIIMVIYVVGVSIAGLATNIVFMLIARAIQGIGLSMFPIAFGIVRDQFPREKISIGQGVITSMFASGAVMGLLFGGTIIQDYGWQATFFTIIPIAITLLAVIRRFIKVDEESRTQQEEGRSIQNVGIGIKTGTNISSKSSGSQIDIKGAITLAMAVTSFLLALTYMETGSAGSNTINNSSDLSIQVVSFFVTGIISFVLFIITERRAKYPLVDLKLMLNKAILPANLIIMIVGMSMFMVFQTIPILVRDPQPLGFGEDVIKTGDVQLPFAVVLLVFGASSGFIISKLGSLKPIIAGSVVTALSFFGLLTFHSSELFISLNLAILSIGLSLTSVGAMNVIILTTPKQFTGISLGTTMLMRIIGSSVGPALAGMYMQSHQSPLDISGIIHSFPSLESFNMIFLTAVVFSIASIFLAILLRRRVMRMSIPNLS